MFKLPVGLSEKDKRAKEFYDKHRNDLREWGKKYNIKIPEFNPPYSPNLRFVIQVHPGRNEIEGKRNVQMVLTLLGMLGFGSSGWVNDYGFFGSAQGFIVNSHHDLVGTGTYSWIDIGTFDLVFFRPNSKNLGDVIVEVGDGDGERTHNFIFELLTSNGYKLAYKDGSASGCSRAWRYEVSDLLPNTTITLLEQIETGS